MKKVILALMLLTLGELAGAKPFDFNHQSGLREHQPLIIEISDVQIKHCPGCNNPMTTISYQVEVKDAYLGMETINSAMGVTYSPYLKNYNTEVKLSYFADTPASEVPEVPLAGQYIGTVWQTCAPWGMAADGSCRDWQVKFNLSSKVIEFKN